MLSWYVIGLAAAVGIACVAALLHVSGYAPIGIISLGVGGVLGAVLAGLAAILNVRCGKRLVAGTLLLAIVAVLAEHAWLYGDFRRQWHSARAKSPEAAMFRPENPWSPGEYFARELTPGRAALWALDAVLIIGAAVVTVFVLRRVVDERLASDAAK